MTPLAQLPPGHWRHIHGVFTDIDDTLTTDGALTADARAALAALRAAGLPVIAITGRPVGWSQPFARQWPLSAIVAENGAVALIPQSDGSLRKLYAEPDSARRQANYQRLQTVAAQVLREVPGARLAQDSPGRETDIAIDHSEHHRLPAEAIEQAAALMRREGLNATVSSIHINGWLGAHDKFSGAHWIARALLGRELAGEIDRWLYVGDSSNDERMFQHFPHSVGVANIARFAPHMQHLPRYIASSPRGAGFAQAAHALLAQRQA